MTLTRRRIVAFLCVRAMQSSCTLPLIRHFVSLLAGSFALFVSVQMEISVYWHRFAYFRHTGQKANTDKESTREENAKCMNHCKPSFFVCVALCAIHCVSFTLSLCFTFLFRLFVCFLFSFLCFVCFFR